MSRLIKFQINEIEPSKGSALIENGYNMEKIPESIHHLIEEAFSHYRSTADPRVICADISKQDFPLVLVGNGKNDKEIPVQKIFPLADKLTLFALTLGEVISSKIQDLFNDNDFALAHMLDCIASISADNAVKKLENTQDKALSTLAYSPGYCGWHLSGQEKLFEYLNPQQIGISLNDSFLMIPVKSVSGVLISGHKKIHKYKNTYDFCSVCKSKNCLIRMKDLNLR